MPVPIDDLRRHQQLHEKQGYIHFDQIAWAILYTAQPFVIATRLCPYCYHAGGIPIEEVGRIHPPGYFRDLRPLKKAEYGIDLKSSDSVKQAREYALAFERKLDRIKDGTTELLEQHPNDKSFSLKKKDGKVIVVAAAAAGVGLSVGVTVATGGAALLIAAGLAALFASSLGTVVALRSLFGKNWPREAVERVLKFVDSLLESVRSWVDVYRHLPAVVEAMKRSKRPNSSPEFEELTTAVQVVSQAGHAMKVNPAILTIQNVLKANA